MNTERTLADFLSSYQGSQLKIADSTRQQMQIAVRLFDRHVGRPVLVAELTEVMLTDFLSVYATRVSPATVNGKRRMLLALWTQATREGLIRGPERLRVPKARELRRMPQAWTVEEVSRLIRTAGSMTGYVGQVPRGDWWSSLLYVIWETSCRVSALLSVHPRDFHLDEKYLLVRAEHTKCGIDEFFRISSDCVGVVAKVYNANAANVWPWPFSTRHFFKTLRQLVDFTGLHSDRQLAMQLSHKLRRSTLTYTAANGGLEMARRQAGHASTAMTKRCYIDPRITQEPAAFDVLPRLQLPNLVDDTKLVEPADDIELVDKDEPENWW